MIKCLIDTNIFLDVFLEREDFIDDSRNLLRLFEFSSLYQGALSASIITDIYYIGRKKII